MKIQIQSLQLKNFKGVSDRTVEFGKETNIYGQNETGKTTVFDAFTWLLFDKDSLGQSDIGIKPLDENNNEIPDLQNEVSATLLIDGEPLELKKIHKEKWTKKRGSAKPVFTGHTTDYFIQEVPASKSEYDNKINDIIPEIEFKLLTDPRFFNEQLHWTEQREILLDIVGGISDDEVIASDQRFEILQQKTSVEDQKKIISAKLKRINNEIKLIPVRIDEAKNSLKVFADQPKKDLEVLITDLQEIKREIKATEQEISLLNQNEVITEAKRELRNLENKIEDQTAEVLREHRKQIENLEDEKIRLQKERERAEREQQDLLVQSAKIQEGPGGVREIEQEIERLKNEWYETRDETADILVEDQCPTCGQLLPIAQVEETRNKAEQSFNRSKAEKLKTINEQGKQLKSELLDKKKTITGLEQKAQELEKSIKELEKSEKTAFYKLKEQTEKQIAIEVPEEISERIRELKEIIEGNTDNGIKDKTKELDTRLADLEQEADYVYRLISAAENNKKVEARIQELKDKERELAKEYEQQEQHLFIAEEFMKAKVELLDEKLKKHFKKANFKLFEEQINGGIKEVCETTYKGVPYRILNNASRTNIGIDIINTLQKHLGVEAPIFIDNREAINELEETPAQTISLIVSTHKYLRVEAQ